MISANRSEYRTLVVDEIRTAYLDVGQGRPVVLLHSGEYGASARLCWEFNIDALAAAGYRVIAPDWLGFGGTDKLFDFGGGRARRIQHMRRYLNAMDIRGAAFIGSSMGGSVLAATAATRPEVFDASAVVLSSGGGYAPDNAARRTILDYDCTIAGMRRIVSTIFHDRSWSADNDYVRRRHEASIFPGAYEATAAPRFKAPTASVRSDFGHPDNTPYEQLTVPTLVIAGAHDPLRIPGYADDIAARMPSGRALVYGDCAHMPHAEAAERFNEDTLEFLSKVYPT
jgi:pimeloyl-ACP methyl ester carboxylesterase